MRTRWLTVSVAFALLTTQVLADGAEQRLSIGGVLAYSEALGSSRGQTGAPFQPELTVRPARSSEFFVKLGFAGDSTTNGSSPFALPPWAVDRAADVEAINGRDRDHLLQAWYRLTVDFGADRMLRATAGIIDAADFLDGNAYSNDEFAQFMNAALVNSATLFIPAYDGGVALDWATPRWSARGVYMNVGENDAGNDYDFYGFELARRLDAPTGRGNYRLSVNRTNGRFSDRAGAAGRRLAGIGLSFDQELGDLLGVFVRIGWQDDEAAIDYESSHSIGVHIHGNAWGRTDDNIGVGLAYLNGNRRDLERTCVTEAYYRYVLNDFLALTGDVQYMADDRGDRADPADFILGVRATIEF